MVGCWRDVGASMGVQMPSPLQSESLTGPMGYVDHRWVNQAMVESFWKLVGNTARRWDWDGAHALGCR